MTKNQINWNILTIPTASLDLSTVLRSGQAFRWRNIDGTWSCTISNRILLLKCTQSTEKEQIIEYASIPDYPKLQNLELIGSYFNLTTDLNKLYSHWNIKDIKFPKDITGVRILNQEPWETLISFICSSNNNVKRISMLCETLCLQYGKYIQHLNEIPYYSFPKPEDLLNGDRSVEELESELRNLGFGYRAKYIAKTAMLMKDDNKLWLKLIDRLPGLKDEEVHDFLLQFPGVGPKVADCVSLMGLGRDNVVPVDTHVWNVVGREYGMQFKAWLKEVGEKNSNSNSLKNSAVASKMYPLVRKFLKDYWGIKAGWAQAVVFAGEVKLDNGINDIKGVTKLLGKRKREEEHFAVKIEDRNQKIKIK